MDVHIMSKVFFFRKGDISPFLLKGKGIHLHILLRVLKAPKMINSILTKTIGELRKALNRVGILKP